MSARNDRQLVVKPQDLYPLLALAAAGRQGTTYPERSACAARKPGFGPRPYSGDLLVQVDLTMV